MLLFVASAACVAHGAVPPIDFTVSDAGGKVAFKGTTGANGVFATGKLGAGNYVVQFRARDAALKGKQFVVVLTAGTKKLSSGAVEGEKIIAGAVAARVAIGADTAIHGQVAVTSMAAPKEAGAASGMSTMVKYVQGKKYVWLPPETGSHFGGRWVPADEVEAHSNGVLRGSAADLQELKDRSSH